jgi:hypothetical protein
MTVPVKAMPLDRCGGQTTAGGTCTQRAGWGTDHPGTGRCKLHGGSVPVKTGRYSKYLRGPFGEKVREHLNDPNPLDLTPEIALLRGHIDMVMDIMEREDRIPKESEMETLRQTLGSLQRLADTVSKIETRAALTTREMVYVVTALADVLREEIEDADQLRRILGKIERRVLVRQGPLLAGGD